MTEIYDLEEIMEKIGNNNKFQKICLVLIFVNSIFVNFFPTMIGILTVPPSYNCYDDKKNLVNCTYKQACSSEFKQIYYNPPYSLITKLNMECEEFLTSTLNSSVFVGVLFGLAIFHLNTKLLGRKNSILMWLIISSTCYFLMTIINDYYTFVSLIIILSTGSAISGVSGYLLLIDLVSFKKRSVYGIITNSALPFGAIIYLTMISTIGTINIILLLIGSSSLAIAMLIWLYCCDSPRIIMSKLIKNKSKDQNEIIQTLRYIANKNGMKIEKDWSKIEIKIGHSFEDSIKQSENFIDILKNQGRIFFILCYLWFGTASIYYGCVFYLRKQSKNILLQAFALYTPDIFSNALVSITTNIKVIGRKKTFITLYLIGSFSCIMKIFYDDQNENMIFYYVFLILIKFCINGAYSTTYTYTSEIYPTSVRNKAFTANSIFSRFSGIITPYIISYLDHKIYLYFSIIAIMASVLVIFLVETNGNILKESYNENFETKRESLI